MLGWVIVLGVLVRLLHLNQPLRYDEAVTWLEFARTPWGTLIADYRYPNNHVLHTLLVKASAGLFGPAPWALRLPAFVAGVALIPLTYLVGRRWGDASRGLLAAAVVAGSGTLTLYATNARGYSLVAVAVLVLLLALDQALQRGGWPWLVLAALATGLGLWTVPTMLLSVVGVALWLLLTWWRQPGRSLRGLTVALASLAAGGGLAVLLYAPILRQQGVAALTANRFVRSETTGSFLQQAPDALGDVWALLTLGLWPPLAVLALLLMLAGVLTSWRGTVRSVEPLGPLLIGGLVLSALLGRWPPARAWVVLIPCAALALAAALRSIERRAGRHWAPALALALAVGSAVGVTLSGAIWESRDTGTCPDAPQIAAVLAPLLQPGDHILAGIEASGPLRYWLDQAGVPPAYIVGPTGPVRRYLVVVNHWEGEDRDRMLQRLRVPMERLRIQPVAQYPGASVWAITLREGP